MKNQTTDTVVEIDNAVELSSLFIVLKSIASIPNMIAEIWGKVDLGKYGHCSASLATLNKSDDFGKNPDGYWMPLTSVPSKDGRSRFTKVTINDVQGKQVEGALKIAIIELIKTAKANAVKTQSTAHDWLK